MHATTSKETNTSKRVEDPELRLALGALLGNTAVLLIISRVDPAGSGCCALEIPYSRLIEPVIT